MKQKDVSAGILETGTYRNDSKQQCEAWAVNQKTGEKRFLGFLTYELAESYPRAKTDWAENVWGSMLKAIL